MLMLLSLAAASVSPCRIDDADDTLRGATRIDAYFRHVDGGPDWPGRLALATHFADTGRTYWWLPGAVAPTVFKTSLRRLT